MCGLVEHRAQQGIATFGYPAIIVDLARLVALRRQADMRADRPGMDEALRLVDRRTVSQRDDGADPWGSHQPPAHRVAADRVEQHLVQDGELLAHDPADIEQRLGDRGQPRKALDEIVDPRLVSTATDGAYLQTEIAQRAAQVGLQVQQLTLQQFAAGQQHALFLGNQRLHMHRLEQPDPHHLRDPARIVAVCLVDLLRRQQRLHVPRLDADHRQLRRRQGSDQPLRQRTGFDPDPAIGHVERGQKGNDIGRFGGYFLLQDHLAGIVDNAHRRFLHRHIKTCEMRHLIAPSPMLEVEPTSIHSSSQKGMRTHRQRPEPQPPRYTIYVLEGSVQRAGNRVRINAQLIDAETDGHVWAERFDRAIEDLFAYFRGDAAFGNPEMYEYLEAEGIGYAIRLPANRILQDRIGYLLKRPVGRPPHEA